MKKAEIGSNQLGVERGRVNDRVDRLEGLGKSKTAEWRRKRRNRAF